MYIWYCWRSHMSFRAERRGMPVVEATYRRTVPGDPAKRTHHPASRSGETPHHCELRSGLSEQRRYVEIANIRATRQGRDPEARRTHRVLATGRTLSLDQLGLVLSHARPEYQGLLAQPQLLTETAKRRTKFLRRLPVPSHRLLPESAPARPSHIWLFGIKCGDSLVGFSSTPTLR